MLRKKVYKILSVLVAVLIASSCCCISASAQTVGTNVKSFSDFFSLSSAHLSYLEDGGDPNNTTSEDPWTNMTDSVSTSLINNSLILTLSGDKSFAIWEWMKITAVFDVKPEYVQDGFSSGSFWITIDNDWIDEYLFTPTTWTTAYGYSCPDNSILKISDKANLDGTVTYNHYQKLTCNIPENKTSDDFLRVRVTFYIHLTSTLYSSESIKFNFNTLNVNLMTADEKNINTIVQNQNENTDKIVNGWEQDDKIDYSTTDDYAAKDKELQEATEQGRSEAVSVFNSFGSLFPSDGHLYKGLLSVSAIFTEFMKIDWLSSLLNFSLAIGIFAFIIGTGSSIFKSAHEQHTLKKEKSYASSERERAKREGLM